MIRAHIKSANDELIGTINEEDGGFRIWWRERMENQPGIVHSAEGELHPTFEAASERVQMEVQDTKIIEL